MPNFLTLFEHPSYRTYLGVSTLSCLNQFSFLLYCTLIPKVCIGYHFIISLCFSVDNARLLSLCLWNDLISLFSFEVKTIFFKTDFLELFCPLISLVIVTYSFGRYLSNLQVYFLQHFLDDVYSNFLGVSFFSSLLSAPYFLNISPFS